MGKFFLFLTIFCFTFCSNLLGMDFLTSGAMKKKDIIFVKKDGCESFCDKSISGISGPFNSVITVNWFDSNFFLGKYLVKIVQSKSVEIFEDFRKKKKLFLKELDVGTSISRVGVTLSCDKQNREDYNKIKYFLLFSAYTKEVSIFEIGNEKLIFNSILNNELCNYMTCQEDRRRFIIFVFENRVELFDLDSIEKLDDMFFDGEVQKTFIYCKDGYLIFFVNNKIKVISVLDKCKTILSKEFESDILGCLSIKKYLATYCKDKDEGYVILSLLDVENEKRLFQQFKLSSKNKIGFYRGLDEIYFWVLSSDYKNVHIYNIYPGKFKEILKKRFVGKTIKNFNIEKRGEGCGRDIDIEFYDKTGISFFVSTA